MLEYFAQSSAYHGAMNVKVEGGRRLREARRAKGLTLNELAECTGGLLSPSRIGNYEQGTRRIPPEYAMVLGNILGVPAVHLLCIQTDKTSQEDEMTPEELTLLKHFRVLDEADRARALIAIEVMGITHRKAPPEIAAKVALIVAAKRKARAKTTK